MIRTALALLGVALVSSVALPAVASTDTPWLRRLIFFEELEDAFDGKAHALRWDMTSWVGGDWQRIWLKSDGEAWSQASSAADGVTAEVQLLYGRLIAPFWDLQIGLRGELTDVALTDGATVDMHKRVHLTVGVEGLAPYRFDLEPRIFISQDGDLSARLRVAYALAITQRLMARPSAEINAALQSVPAFSVGKGLNDLEAGLRLGYQILREIEPYVGLSWSRAFGETARLLQTAGDTTRETRGVAGLRAWF